MKFDILDVVSLDDYSIKKEDRSCEMCGNKKNTYLAIVRYATNLTPQEDEILCNKCLKREGWKFKGLGGYSIKMINTQTESDFRKRLIQFSKDNGFLVEIGKITKLPKLHIKIEEKKQ